MAEVDGQAGDDEREDAQEAAQDDQEESAAIRSGQGDPAPVGNKVKVHGQVHFDGRRGLPRREAAVLGHDDQMDDGGIECGRIRVGDLTFVIDLESSAR